MLRIAVPNKGSLSDPAALMLTEAGYRQRLDSRELVLPDPDNDTEFFFLRPRDIAVYVGAGRLDLGITGTDLMLDSGAKADVVLPLGFGWVDVPVRRSATEPGAPNDVSELAGLRVATAYPGLVSGYLAERGVNAEVIRLDGAVETAVALGVADVIADVVSTAQLCAMPVSRSSAAAAAQRGRPHPRVRHRCQSAGRAADPPPAGSDHRPGSTFSWTTTSGTNWSRPRSPSPRVSSPRRCHRCTRPLVGGPGDGSRPRHQRDHGSAVGPGCPGHPGH